MTNKSQTIQFMDTAKGILIILIVLGHAQFPLRNFVYLFHVAAFFFISGYFFKDEHLKKPINFIVKRVRSLYLPFLAYALLFISLHNVFVKWNVIKLNIGTASGGNYLYGFQDYINVLKQNLTFGNTEQLLVPLWFITVLFTVTIFFFLLKLISTKLMKNYQDEVVLSGIVGLFVIGAFLSYNHILLPRLINTSFVALGVYYIGYLYKKYESNVSFNAVYCVIALTFLTVNSFFGTIEMVTNRFPDPPFFLLNALLGTYVVLYISKKLSEKTNIFDRFLQYAGQNSFHILALHLLAFKLATFILIKANNYPIKRLAEFPIMEHQPYAWILYSLLGIIVPLVLVFSFKEINKVVLNQLKEVRT